MHGRWGTPGTLSRGGSAFSTRAGRRAPPRGARLHLPTMDIHLVFCSCPDPATASRLATAVVEERLAACASVLPGMRSVYRWQGAVEQADEVLLMAKAPADRLPRLVERLQALHPYELPEVLAVKAAGGLPAYLGWVVEATRD